MSRAKPRRPSAPSTLQARGRRFWRRVLEDVELDIDGMELLHETCETLDTIDRLRAQIAERGETVAGSMGQPVAHPLLSELRQHQRQLADFLKRLDIEPAEEQTPDGILRAVPDPTPTPGARQAANRAALKKAAASRNGRKAADARWRG